MQPDNQTKFSAKSRGHPELVLYSRPDCHLCDVAAGILEAENMAWRKENIETDLELISRYGTRIPVLVRTDTAAELGWPFTPSQARRFMEQPK